MSPTTSTQKTYTVRGKSYEPVLSPQERIMMFLSDMEQKINDGMLSSTITMLNCAKIYFKDELNAVEK